MLLLKLKMSTMTDAIIALVLFIVIRILMACNASHFKVVLAIIVTVFVALLAEMVLSFARACLLDDMFKLQRMTRREADRLQKEVDRLNQIISRQTLCRSGKKPLKRNKSKS